MKPPPTPSQDDDRAGTRGVAPVDAANDHRRRLCAFKACPVCGARLPLERNPKARRERIYCSDACRARAWRRAEGESSGAERQVPPASETSSG